MNNSELREHFLTLFDENSRIEIYLDSESKGWLTPTTEMLERLVEEQGNTPALRIRGITEKRGYLRVYGDDFSEQADAIIKEAQEKTAVTCDVCGAPGKPNITPGGWTVGIRCAKHMKKFGEQKAALSADWKQAKVGIFFVVNGDVIFDAVPHEQGEPYGDTAGFGGHDDYWQALIPKSATELLFKSHAYDYFPRGRVVHFNIKDGIGFNIMDGIRFKLYADRCLTEADIKKVVKTFQLPAFRLVRDEHYQCAGCNPGYVNIH